MGARAVKVVEREVIVALQSGLHARPAAQFVHLAAQFESKITVCAEARSAPAGSLLTILSLGVRRGSLIKLQAVGPDAEVALDALARYLLTEEEAGA